MAVGPLFQPFLNESFKMLFSACSASLSQVSEDEDPDMYDYLIELRMALVECFIAIVHGAINMDDKTPLVEQTNDLMDYLGRLVNDTREDKVSQKKAFNSFQELVNQVLGLIGDLADCCGKQIEP